jgi:hypothetical protein
MKKHHGWSFLTLRPFGDSLCTPGARAWLAAATVAVAIMGASEALAWGYMGYWFTAGPLRYLIATLLGTVVLLLIVIVDAAFLTFDLYPKRYEISNAKADHDDVKRSRLWGRVRKASRWLWKSPVPGFVIRMAMVFGSLAISSRYLTSAVLAPDITAQLERQRGQVTEARATEIGQGYDKRIAETEEEMAQFRRASLNEAAGVGPSRLPGRGPAVETAEARLAELEGNVETLRLEKQADLEKYRRSVAAAANDRTSQGGMQERSAALELLKQSPGYEESQLPIKGYLVGVFLTILILKAFQRRSLAIYFSERLQDTHTGYLEGRFDEWVPHGVRSSDTHRMSPFDFEDWYFHSHKARLQQQELEAKMGEVKDQHVAFAGILNDRSGEAEKELKPLTTALENLEQDLVNVEDNVAAREAEIKSLERVIDANNVWIADMNSQILALDRLNTTAKAVGADVYVGALHSRSFYVSKVSEMETELDEARTKLAILQRDKSDITAERDRRKADLDLKRTYLTTAERERNDARLDELRQLGELRKRYDPLR